MLTNKISQQFDELVELLNKHNITVNATVTREFERNLDEVNALTAEARNLIWTLAVMAKVSESTAVKNVLHNLDEQELIKDAVALPISLELDDLQEVYTRPWAPVVRRTGNSRHRLHKPWFGRPVLVLQHEYAQYIPANPRNGIRQVQHRWWEDAETVEGTI